MVAELGRLSARDFGLVIRWFRVPSGPPPSFGRYADFVALMSEQLGDREVSVTARFSYDTARISSIFTPIHVSSEAAIFDEIIGFTGVKRSSEGKRLYSLDVRVSSNRLEHIVAFSQKVQLSNEIPVVLLDIARKISDLGLKKRE